jgi:Fe-S-cluster-containing hydrogenase component 2
MIKMNKPPAIVVSTEFCRGCDMCTLACSLYHTGQCNPGQARLRVTKDIEQHRFSIVICKQCEEPACFEACPADAMERDDEGVVSIIAENCIACGSCQAACPYEAITFHEGTDYYLKCDLCKGRAEGPMCAEVCPTGAVSFGDEGGAWNATRIRW